MTNPALYNNCNISACIITDGADLDKLFKAVRSCFSSCSEIVICANGKYEEVKFTFRNYSKVKVFPQVWENDFAKARNEVMSYASGEWILSLDSDEELLTPIEFLNTDCDGFRVVVTSMYSNVDNTVLSHRAVRIFRRDKRIKWSNKIHEKVDASIIENGFKIIDCDIQIFHSGYVDLETVQTKNKRNYQIMLEDVDNPEHEFNLVRHHSLEKEYDKVMEWGGLVLTNDKYDQNVKAITCIIMAIAYRNGYNATNESTLMLLQSLKFVPYQLTARVYLIEELIKYGKKGLKEKVLEQMAIIKEVNQKRNSKLAIDFYMPEKLIDQQIQTIQTWQ